MTIHQLNRGRENRIIHFEMRSRYSIHLVSSQENYQLIDSVTDLLCLFTTGSKDHQNDPPILALSEISRG